MRGLRYADWLDDLRAHAAGARVSTYGVVEERGRRYPLVAVTVAGAPEVVITSGFHGDERAGPLTLATHLQEIVRLARAKGVGLRVYPCANPAGFEARTRYNPSGERPNNDFLRYEIAPGEWRGELRDGEAFRALRPFAVDEADRAPKETRALARELARHPAPAAALDLHQDAALGGRLTYAYAFGERASHVALLRASAAHAHVARAISVDGPVRTDGDGLILYHDGSVSDYFVRRGTRFAAAVETTTDTPLAACHAIHLLWIARYVELAR